MLALVYPFIFVPGVFNYLLLFPRFIEMILLFLLTITAGTVVAAPQPVEDNPVLLVGISNTQDAGILIIFRVTKSYSTSELNSGQVWVKGGSSYGLYCTQISKETVHCTTSKKTGGRQVIIYFVNNSIWAKIPSVHIPPPPPVYDNCYVVYDWNWFDKNAGNEFPTYWEYQGQHCQEFPANDGEVITYYSPYWSNTYEYG